MANGRFDMHLCKLSWQCRVAGFSFALWTRNVRRWFRGRRAKRRKRRSLSSQRLQPTLLQNLNRRKRRNQLPPRQPKQARLAGGLPERHPLLKEKMRRMKKKKEMLYPSLVGKRHQATPMKEGPRRLA